MLYKIKNTSHRGKAFKVKGGTEVVKAGATENVDCQAELTDEQIEAFKASGVIITKAVKEKAKAA